jgi:NHLM bacteriocin system ABC transporter ATP-binding protein
MNESGSRADNFAVTAPGPVGGQPQRVILDSRNPKPLDHHGHALLVAAGCVDLYAVKVVDSRTASARHHLFRVDSGEVILDLPSVSAGSGESVQVIAVGSVGAEATLLPRPDLHDPALVAQWIGRLAQVIAGPNPSWEIPDAPGEGTAELKAGERCRGPARHIVWLSVHGGTARVMGREPPYQAGSPVFPLTSGLWVEAVPGGCTVSGGGAMPADADLWRAMDQFHLCAMACICDRLAQHIQLEWRRLVRRNELATTHKLQLLERLSSVIMRRVDHDHGAADHESPLVAACRVAGFSMRVPIVAPPGRAPLTQGDGEIVEIARASRLRVRRTLLRGEWWKRDVGALVAWHGEERSPVALVRTSWHRYEMVEPKSRTRRLVDRTLAMELAPEAVTFYPALPSASLRFRDLLQFSLWHGRGNLGRIALAVLVLGLLSLVPPLVTEVLVNSAIPRSELDQLTFCALGLAVTAVAMASVQVMEGVAMLRLEGLIDWKLQAAVLDRLLRLPASLFREYTVGDLVDRVLGIDAVRRIFTGRTLRSLMSGVFCWFSIALMCYYDFKLALVAIALTILRGLLIIATSAVRLRHESRHFNVQGKLSGFVLQLLAGIGKLRVAAATVRALAVWSAQFATQKQHFIASQRAANVLGVIEASFPPLATIVIFAVATRSASSLTLDLGAFLAFFTAFGQAMASVGTWATGVSDSLIAIPHLTRIRPLIATAAEVSDDRKSPGELSGGIDVSRVTFRYMAGGPPVLDNVTLRITPGEYVALVGPSGSGKSSLLRLLLGFEKPESGAIFFDGKALDTLDISSVRRQLGVVLQNGRLTTGSLYHNICGGVQLPLEQAWEAARLAGLEADIKAMPMGMHTMVAEGVNTLSGGQRQRVMIARAIARRPRILLLDEATSALDNQSQGIVTASLGALNVTRIVVAHRLSTVRQADRIVVLVEGKVVQVGTFAELSGASGVFADFAQRQLL